MDTRDVQIGALSNAFTSFTWCNQAAIDVELAKEGHKNCSANMNANLRASFKKEMKRKCHGKDKC